MIPYAVYAIALPLLIVGAFVWIWRLGAIQQMIEEADGEGQHVEDDGWRYHPEDFD